MQLWQYSYLQTCVTCSDVLHTFTIATILHVYLKPNSQDVAFIHFSNFNVLAGGPKKESSSDDDGQEPEAPEPFEWPDDI